MNITETAKKAVLALAIAFAAYYLVTQPANAADAVKSALAIIADAVQAIGEFFRRLVA